MKSLLVILSIMIFLSCSENIEHSPKDKNEEPTDSSMLQLELEVIASFLDTRNSSLKAPPSFLIQLPEETNGEYENRVSRQIDSLHSVWDTTTFQFYIIDTLHSIGYNNILPLLDSTFVIDSTSVLFNEEKIHFDYRLLPVKKIELINEEYQEIDRHNPIWADYKFNGIVGFSRMIFNNDSTRVIFLKSIHCGHFCGGGSILKLEKNNGKWQTIDSKQTWVE